MEPVRGIGFDLDHTLAIDNRLERVAFLHLLEELLRQGGRSVGTLADEIASIDELLARQRGGELSIDDAVRRFVERRALEPEERHVQSFRRDAVEMVGEFVVALPGVRPMLDALRERGIALAILSNGWNPLQGRKAEQVDFRGPILVSSDIGAQKPSQPAFAALLSALGTDPRHTWFVGDDPRSDVAGAQAVGIRAVWMNWEGKAYPDEQSPPERTIDDFCQLLELLPAPAEIR